MGLRPGNLFTVHPVNHPITTIRNRKRRKKIKSNCRGAKAKLLHMWPEGPHNDQLMRLQARPNTGNRGGKHQETSNFEVTQEREKMGSKNRAGKKRYKK